MECYSSESGVVAITVMENIWAFKLIQNHVASSWMGNILSEIGHSTREVLQMVRNNIIMLHWAHLANLFARKLDIMAVMASMLNMYIAPPDQTIQAQLSCEPNFIQLIIDSQSLQFQVANTDSLS